MRTLQAGWNSNFAKKGLEGLRTLGQLNQKDVLKDVFLDCFFFHLTILDNSIDSPGVYPLPKKKCRNHPQLPTLAPPNAAVECHIRSRGSGQVQLQLPEHLCIHAVAIVTTGAERCCLHQVGLSF